MKKIPGSIWKNNGLWNWRVRLPGDDARKNYPVRAPGSKTTMTAGVSRDVAEAAVRRMWEAAERGNRPQAAGRLRLGRLIDDYLAEIRVYYRSPRTGMPGSQAQLVEAALAIARRDYCNSPPEALTAGALRAMVDEWVTAGRVRTTVNKRLQIIARFARWMLAHEHIDAHSEAVVARYPRLAKGRSPARENPPVQPADLEAVRELLARLTPTLRDMVQVHLIGGMRSGEVCDMTADQIDRSDAEIWIYSPRHHKTSYRGTRRHIPIFAEAQALLLPRIESRQPHEPLFSAAESHREHLARKHAARKTPMNEGNKPAGDAVARGGDRYTPASYGQRIRQTSERIAREKWRSSREGPEWEAHLSRWRVTPHQLRHAAATENRALAGRAIAAILLGHAEGSTATEVYTQAAIKDEAMERARQEVREAARALAKKKKDVQG